MGPKHFSCNQAHSILNFKNRKQKNWVMCEGKEVIFMGLTNPVKNNVEARSTNFLAVEEEKSVEAYVGEERRVH